MPFARAKRREFLLNMVASSVAGVVITHTLNWCRGDVDAFAVDALLNRHASGLLSLCVTHASHPCANQPLLHAHSTGSIKFMSCAIIATVGISALF